MTRTYTTDDLLASSTYSTGESYAFSYTPTDRLSGVSGAGQSLAFTYNPVGWLTSVTDTRTSWPPSPYATTYAYDAAGRVTTLDTDAAPALTYAYDLAGRLTSLESSSAVTGFAHDAAGARTSMTLPNGAATSYAYDPAGRIESIVTTATSGVISWDYTRDAAGRVTSDASGSYTYDDAGRLVSWETSSGEITTYTYDAASNLTGASVDGSATASFTFDAADRITNAGYTYDAAGNLTSDGTRIFTYDAACRLVAVADASTETTIATYTYDAFNRRTSSTEGTAAVFFHYDGASARVLAETDLLGSVLASYTYDDAGQLHSMSREGATYYYHLNARGDVVALTDSTGAVVNTYAYDPWGQLLSADETVSNPYRYASYRYDAESGLYCCWNRYYAPALARFITRDIYPGELADPVSMNPYLYCGGDPVNAVDPSGMTKCQMCHDNSTYGRRNNNMLLVKPTADTYASVGIGVAFDLASLLYPTSAELKAVGKGASCSPRAMFNLIGQSGDALLTLDSYEDWVNGEITKGQMIQDYLQWMPGGSIGTLAYYGIAAVSDLPYASRRY